MTNKQDIVLLRQVESAIKTQVDRLEGQLPQDYLDTIQAAAKQLIDSIRYAHPDHKCPSCFGGGCRFCYGTGWVSKQHIKLAPKEMRQFVE